MAGRLAAWSTPEMLPAHAIDAVVFDMGGVFMVPCPRRIGDELTAAGIEHGLDGETAPGAHYAGVRAITDLLADRAVAEDDPTIWRHYDRRAFAHVGLTGDRLEAALEVRDRMRERSVWVWEHPLAANIAAFARIAGRVPVAIVSNNDDPLNQMTLDYVDQLREVVDDIAADASIRAFIVTAEGTANF